MRFLIDECLTVDLVAVAGQAGHGARHIAHIGKSGWKDWNVARYAGDGDFVLGEIPRAAPAFSQR